MKKQVFTRSNNKSSFASKIASLRRPELLALIVIVILASITQSWHFLATGWLRSSGIQFSQLHDSLWHLALIKEIAREFPPQHPGLAGIPLSNYHFLSDFILMFVHKISGLSVETVYFHIAPPIVSALFSLSLFTLAKQLSKSNWIANIAVGFTVFGGSFAYLIPLLLGSGTSWFANSFMLDQPFDQLTNVHTVLGFSIFLFAISFLWRYLEERKDIFGLWAGIFFGMATSIKAYAGAVGVIALIITAVVDLILHRRKRVVYPTLIAIGIFISLTLSINTSTKPPLVFAPGWILKKMVEDSGRFYNAHLTQLDQHYQATKNIPRLIQINMEELILYFVGNLGVRILAFAWIAKKIVSIRKTKTIHLFIITAIGTSLSTPLLFVQPVSAYNTIQFSPYALMLLSILLVIWASEKKQKAVLLLILFFLSIPSTVKTLVLRTQEEQIMSTQEYQALRFLEEIPDSAVILTPPNSEHRYLMKVPGLGGRRAYFSGETFAILTDTEFQSRLKTQEEFFNSETSEKKRKEILQDAKITHIYSDVMYQTEMLKKLEKQWFPVRLLFENEKSGVFEVI